MKTQDEIVETIKELLQAKSEERKIYLRGDDGSDAWIQAHQQMTFFDYEIHRTISGIDWAEHPGLADRLHTICSLIESRTSDDDGWMNEENDRLITDFFDGLALEI